MPGHSEVPPSALYFSSEGEITPINQRWCSDSLHTLKHHTCQEILQDTSKGIILFWTNKWNLRCHGIAILVFRDLSKSPIPISVMVPEFAQVTLEVIPNTTGCPPPGEESTGAIPHAHPSCQSPQQSLCSSIAEPHESKLTHHISLNPTPSHLCDKRWGSSSSWL